MPPTSENLDIVKRIADRRKRLRLTQVDISDRLGWNRTTYQMLETGKNQLSVSQLMELAEVLQTSVAYLVGEITEREIADSAAIAGYDSLNARDKQMVAGIIGMLLEMDEQNL